MRTVPKWVNKIHEADKVEFSSVHTICFSPDGSQLVIGAGEKVMVYDPRDGSLLQLLQAHRGAVYAVAYCPDGSKFASGSADKNVIIWTSKMEGVLKYSHSEAIQCLAYNPVTLHLASCALSDFAFWSTDVKAVQKYRVSGRITCCAWSPNGQYLAIGLASGTVSIRDKTGDEIQRIGREHAVWAVAFSGPTLLVGDWGDTLSFYDLQGQSVLKDRNIGISAVSLSTLGGLIVAGGVGGWSVLTAEGVRVLHTPGDWVWAAQPSPALDTMAVGCGDGTLWCYQVALSTVHGLYRERYAYRENMTDVIVQHLTTGAKVRIKCHDRVHKIAIYKHRLAVQLGERVVVYEQGDAEGMLYRVSDKLPQPAECSLLVATSDALLICQDTKLMRIGRKSPKEWTVPAPIRYVKVTTLALQEVLLLGLMNGQVWQVEPRGGPARLVLQTPGSVRCLDVGAARSLLAVADETSVCRVYSLPAGRLLYTEENVSSVSCNSWCDDLLCLSGGGRLAVKAGLFPPATQPLPGSVVGFQGGRVFCLQSNSMHSINVSLSHALHQYMHHKMFAEAYSVACLGASAAEWARLGGAALEQLSLEVARKALQRAGSVALLPLIDQLQERLESGENRSLVLAEALAYRGRYSDAAKLYCAVGRQDKAIDLYVDLRMFNKAQELLGEGDGATVAALAQRRAQWARHVASPRAAAQMYLAAGDVGRAASLLADNGRTDMLLDLARKLDKGASGALRHVADALAAAGETAAAADIYQRLHDYKRAAELLVAGGSWARAFALAHEHDECRAAVFLPHAHRMARQGNFLEAQRAYHLAGERGTARRVFAVLAGTAVREGRFADAAHLHCVLALQSGGDRAARVSQWRLARIYHSYALAHRCAHEPFCSEQPDAMLNAARLALAPVGEHQPPPGVSILVKNHMLECTEKSYNDIKSVVRELPHSHRIRHSKMIHTQISRLAKTQEETDATISNLRTAIMDLERRVARAEEPNWNLLETKVELLEIEGKILKEEVKNLTERLENVDKLHASVLELREDLEGVENKADKAVPEIRKEISKLDVCMAQLTAQASYLKEAQESIRQSVKAIAVSVSNTMDRVELERHTLGELNGTVSELQRSSRQHFHRLNDHIRKTEANHDNETITDLPELMGQVMDLEPMKQHYEELISELPRDCSQVDGPPAAYLINTGDNPVETWCDHRETVLQRRCNGTVDFNRKMTAYAEGFGDAEGEFWLGLENMHRLTADNCSGMRILMTDIYDKAWYAEYDHFVVGDAASGYKLHISGFSGNASDAFAFHDQMRFSTIDVDRDVSKSHCAGNYEGGWWYSHCQHVNINGKYTLGLTWFDLKKNEWIAVMTSDMRIFRRKNC